jgi:hypothetical protein
VGKLAKSLSDPTVAVNLGPYSDTTKILRLRGYVVLRLVIYPISMFIRTNNY